MGGLPNVAIAKSQALDEKDRGGILGAYSSGSSLLLERRRYRTPRPIFEIITEIHDWQYQVVKDRIACLSCVGLALGLALSVLNKGGTCKIVRKRRW